MSRLAHSHQPSMDAIEEKVMTRPSAIPKVAWDKVRAAEGLAHAIRNIHSAEGKLEVYAKCLAAAFDDGYHFWRTWPDTGIISELRAFGEMPLEGGTVDPIIEVMNGLAHRAADEIERLSITQPAASRPCPRCGEMRDADKPDGCRDWNCPTAAEMKP